MELDEILVRKQHLQHLESLESGSGTPSKPSYLLMDRDEMIRYIEFLQTRLDEEKRARELSDKRFEEESAARREADKRVFELLDQISRMGEQHSREMQSLLQKNQELQHSIEDLTSAVRLDRKNIFCTTSRKSRPASRKPESPSREEERNDFDGSGTPVSSNADVVVEETTEAAPGKEGRDYRKGMKYKTMKANRIILHKSDRSQLPEGALIIRSYTKRYSYDAVVEFIEHDVEVLVYKRPDGKVVTAYLPYKDDDVRNGAGSQFPGTHATSRMMSYVATNNFQMCVPLYRELTRFLNHEMRISDGTLSNWLFKGSEYLKELVPYLKDIALEKNSFVNCDETWCRVRKQGHYSKKYIWCLVNKASKTVIFVYDDGSRGRKVLRDILEDREIAALQSDAYNVYMFIDKELSNVTHLCCMAHARAKFKDALDVGKDERARLFVDSIGLLYRYEEEYRILGLSPDEIRRRRNDGRTADVMIRMSTELSRLLNNATDHIGDMMQKALNYLHNYWHQLFAYRQDGRYTIDNNIAERNIRPTTVKRKNSLFYGSGVMAEVSAIYHTFISTCSMLGISAQKYFSMFFSAIIEGRRDYANLLPMTIGIK
jgi:transposase